MATDLEVRSLFSTLEVVNDDKNAIFQETDLALDAPERDHTAETAQVTFRSGLEIARSITLPEAIANSPDGNDEAASVETRLPRTSGLSRRAVWRLMVLVILVLIGVGIGTGIGVGLRANNTSHDAQSTQEPSPSSISHSSSAFPLPSPSRTTTLPSSTPFSAAHAILNDTSLSAVSTSEGNRHVFFQDQSGDIRESIFDTSNGTWSAPTTYIVATDAKSYTPMSSIQVPASQSVHSSEEIKLFYVAANNSIANRLFLFNEATWKTDFTYLPNLSSLVVATGSRALSATQYVQPSHFISYAVHLLYESAQGGLTWMVGNGSWTGPAGGFSFDWEPLDVSPAVPGKTPLRNNSGPLNLAFQVDDGDIGLGLKSTYISYFQDTFAVERSVLSLSNESFANTSIGSETPFSSLDVHELDISRNGFWIRNSTLEVIDGSWAHELPSVPFRRLASVSPDNSSVTYVYRQLNQTMISEEAYDTSVGLLGQWSSSNFSVST